MGSQRRLTLSQVRCGARPNAGITKTGAGAASEKLIVSEPGSDTTGTHPIGHQRLVGCESSCCSPLLPNRQENLASQKDVFGADSLSNATRIVEPIKAATNNGFDTIGRMLSRSAIGCG